MSVEHGEIGPQTVNHVQASEVPVLLSGDAVKINGVASLIEGCAGADHLGASEEHDVALGNGFIALITKIIILENEGVEIGGPGSFTDIIRPVGAVFVIIVVLPEVGAVKGFVITCIFVVHQQSPPCFGAVAVFIDQIGNGFSAVASV